ncbi:hypothetical protein [Streptomyces sp. NPDC089799]|uniref:hypothetical protein n=1 Tax=Streptomyces sp. NPDC089799 TaxID=3155066 RepID=UPI003436438C
MMTKIAVHATTAAHSAVRWYKSRLEEGGASDRGDISITTVIIWVASAAAAVAIAGGIALLATRYTNLLNGI